MTLWSEALACPPTKESPAHAPFGAQTGFHLVGFENCEFSDQDSSRSYAMKLMLRWFG